MKYQLTDIYGVKHLEEINPANIDEVEEKHYVLKTWSWKFPFFHKEIKPYVKFREYRAYPTIREPNDTKYGKQDLVMKVDCSLSTFCEMFGFEATSLEEVKMNRAIRTGEE